MSELKEKSINATLWSGIDIFLRQGMQFVIAIILARLLSPKEFGTIALLSVFIGLARAFSDGGFSASLVQRQDITHTDESTVFWFNCLIGLCMAILLWIGAPVIARFYGVPLLVPLIALLALSLFLSTIGSIQGALLTRRLDFKTPMKIGIVSTLLSGVIAVYMAWKGFGVWALAGQALASSFITTVSLWVLNKWRPLFRFSTKSIRKLYGFGGYFFLSTVLEIIYSRIYSLLIGKIYGPQELGYYNMAETTKQVPVGALTGIISRVAFPIFSSIAGDKEKLRQGARQALRGIMLISVPMMLGLIATADTLVLVIFGEQWAPAAPILSVLALGGVLWPAHVINLNVLLGQGLSRLMFRLEVVKKTLGVAILISLSYYGVMGIAWGQVVFSILAFGINAHYTRIYLNYGMWQQFLDFWPILLSAICTSFFVYELGEYMSFAPFSELIVQILFGVGVYAGLCHLLGLQAYKDVMALIAEKINHGRNKWRA